ncbi:nucleoside-diphosphate-sugar epimerase GsfE [Penicillium mononematosum]|uniref:nucleoside-diphosphate-sugar epimerase GsfE n=1 Tax=Penicillium mononematosum TaxID=268346 RepID=UPI002549BC18|nr:nucleoside-diphosphate-sugar epimerase GsfE [Penicillium mononematosum]KAJ6178270.1 nucleoside-diphosphate-sugar epimerase GsfE [Penicillium mononematosum]
MASNHSAKVALVTGANGISGHSIVEYLIRRPETEWWITTKIIVTSRRQLQSYWVDPRIEFIALDFLESKETLMQKMKIICHEVTHVYFTSYIHDNDFDKLAGKNCPLFRNFLEVIDTVCPNLERVCLQTGGKHYGVQFQESTTLLDEDLPRYCGPGSKSIFYYQQEDDLFEVQKRKSTWHYNIIRPFGIVGFTPQFSGMNEVVPVAQYFLICRELGEEPRWPGNLSTYHHAQGMSYSPSIADLTIFVTSHDHCKDEAFNHVNGDVLVFKFLWKRIGEYFNVEVPSYSSTLDERKSLIDMKEWAMDKAPVWERIIAKYGGNVDSFQIGAFELMNWFSNPTEKITTPYVATLNKARKAGWGRVDDSYDTWIRTLQSYENAGILPNHRQFQN